MTRKFMPEDSIQVKDVLERLGWTDFTNGVIRSLNKNPDTIQFITPATVTAANIQRSHGGKSAEYFFWGVAYAYAMVANSEKRRKRIPRSGKDDIDPLAAKELADALVERAQKTAREFGRKK